MLSQNSNGEYVYKMDTGRVQNGYDMDTQVRLGKVRLGKDRLDNKKEETRAKKSVCCKGIKVVFDDFGGVQKCTGYKRQSGQTVYKDWFPGMCEYGFTEGQDYITLVGQKCPTNNPKNPWTTVSDAQLTIDMAKEICMLQRNERGKQARQYFIQLEKDWNSPEKVMARALQIADRKIKCLQTENAVQKQLILELKPKADYTDCILKKTKDWYLLIKLQKIMA